MSRFRRSFFLSLVGVLLVPLTLFGEPTLTEIKKLQASDGQAGDLFGSRANISGDTAVVEARLADAGATDAGAAYVFQRDEGGKNNWGQVKKLQAAEPRAGYRFGLGAISGDTIVVGEWGFGNDSNPGAAYVFQRNNGGKNNWGQVKKLRPADLQASDDFGGAGAISGDTAVVSADLADTGGTDAGVAYVFKRNKGGKNNWGKIKKLRAADAEEGDHFGSAVAISGDTAVIGASLEAAGGFDAGAAYVFKRNKGGKNNWGQVKKLQAGVPQEGALFGQQVAISGDTLIVGADQEDTGGTDAGAAYIFERNEGGKNNWGQVKKLRAGDGQAGGRFGRVAISGDTAVVGALREDADGTDSGAAYLFQRNMGGKDNWGQVQKLLAGDLQAEDKFGNTVAISGTTVLVGNAVPVANDEAVYVFSTPEISDAAGDAPAAIDSILADSRQDGSELICTLAIASGDEGLNPKSLFRCHIGFGNLGFGANTTLTYLLKKRSSRCKGMPSLVCSEEEIDLDGNIDSKCDGDVRGDPAAACFITLRGDVQNITDRWLAACTENDCLTPFPAGPLSEYDVYAFWSTKRKKKLDRVPDTDDNLNPDSIDEVVRLTLED